MKTALNFLSILLLTFSVNAQVGIGTIAPQGALNITCADNGLLIPRVALEDLTALTVLTPAESEMLYNTTSKGAVEPGSYYYYYYYYYYYLFVNGVILTRVRFGGYGWLLEGNTDVGFRKFTTPARKIILTNTSFGVGALAVNTNTNNLAIGTNALRVSINGVESVAIGSNALFGTTANNQIQLGSGFITQVRTSGVITAPSYVATVGAATGYADYVFENFFTGESKINLEYNFKSIEETEAFVRQNNHLPGVKSYNEIKKNDFKFSVDELSLSSLEKIEEQFLYITQLNKKIKSQEEDLDRQELKIKSLEARLERIEMLLNK